MARKTPKRVTPEAVAEVKETKLKYPEMNDEMIGRLCDFSHATVHKILAGDYDPKPEPTPQVKEPEGDIDTALLILELQESVDELTKVVPIEIYNTESFFKKNKYVRFDWNDLTCMVRFEDYLLEKSVMPMELVRDNIKEILLIRRKTELIERMKEAIYEEAKRKHGFEVYVGQTTLAPSDSIN